MAQTVAALRPAVEAADVTPDVETIQVEMLGTVNMQMAPIRNTMITVPKERMPFPAKKASLVRSAVVPLAPTKLGTC